MSTQPIENAYGHLMAHAIRWLGTWSGQDSRPLLDGLPKDEDELKPYLDLLSGNGEQTRPHAPLLSIFSLVKDPESEATVPERYWPPTALDLDEVPSPQDGVVLDSAALKPLWAGFEAEGEQVLALSLDDAARFEVFTHLLHKWAWAVPCSYGEPGVSLYDEFRALSALVFASGCTVRPATEFLLVGGDVPGIQKTIYTITSKGAAKGLRGRSFFIQLLGDAVLRRLLAKFKLPEANVVYAAGGNFMLLAPAGAEKRLDRIGRAINCRLLDAFEGDLALCLACEPLAAAEVGSGAFATRASRELTAKIAEQKRRRFAAIAHRRWNFVFGPKGRGGVRFCAVCQHDLQVGEKGRALEDGGWKCDQCAGFEDLAQAIAPKTPLMFVHKQPAGTELAGWRGLLAHLTGWQYDFADRLPDDLPPGTRIYRVNALDFAGRARGFRLIANTTPRDEKGQVRTFEHLADGAVGLKRVGVLRMDVDNLGRVLTQWLPERTMASTSALSHTLDRFFTGWLDEICRDVTDSPGLAGGLGGRGNLLYTIYAGGDDLFVVGAWDLMPLLADRIRRRFAAYTGDNPYLHISAGITLEDRKFPLYQAADRAGKALDHGAKEMPERDVNGRKVAKDAVTFLGKSVGWENYSFVVETVAQLVELTKTHGVPRSLLGTMRAIHDRYCEDVRRARERGLEGKQIYFGPWMWRKAYQLARTRQRYDRAATKAIASQIKDLETRVLTRDNMPYVGLATRWAEYLTRGGEAR